MRARSFGTKVAQDDFKTLSNWPNQAISGFSIFSFSRLRQV